MSRSTPGPWKVAESRMGWDIIVRNAVDAPVCSAIDAGYNKKTAEANARLIAAAPELLEALNALLAASERHIFSTECKTERDAARAAIAKAEGRT